MCLKWEKRLSVVARVGLATIFLIFGLDTFYSFLPLAEPSPAGAAFLTALSDTGYLMTVIKGLEVLCAMMLLFNIFLPLAVLILAPLIVNILLYGIFLDTNYLIVPLFLILFEVILLWHCRQIFFWFFKFQIFSDPQQEMLPKLVAIDESRLAELRKKSSCKPSDFDEILQEVKA